MNTYKYDKDVGYGPFKFGMTPQEVHAILGEPLESGSPADYALIDATTDKELATYWKSIYHEDYDGAHTDNRIPGFLYQNDKLVIITIFNKNEKFEYQGLNLMTPKRRPLMKKLFAMEDDVYSSGEKYYLPKAGLTMTTPEWWKQYPNVSFVQTDFMMNNLDNKCFVLFNSDI